MKQETLGSWEEFEQALRNLETSAGRKQEEDRPALKFLYRGQADSMWKLETTLDRIPAGEVTLHRYYRHAFVAKPRIETFTGKTWSILKPFDYWELIKKEQDPFFWEFKEYEYLAYLRHHGFPSPLLDWTASPYVAAFFAMNIINKGKEGKDVDHVSIYAYCESTGIKFSSSDAPMIRVLGPNAAVHKRHFMQQSEYTICTKIKYIGEGEREISYAPHEEVILNGEKGQDLLWKFNIPTSERVRILRKLQTMNINSFSLFGTEDSLMDSIATSVFLLEGDD